VSRKIIQIVPRGEYAEGLAALCDDGSVWIANTPGDWHRVNTTVVEYLDTLVPHPPVQK